MSSTHILLLGAAAIVAVGSAVVTTAILTSDSATLPVSGADVDPGSRIEALSRRLSVVEEALSNWTASETPAAEAGEPRLTHGDVEDVVRRILDRSRESEVATAETELDVAALVDDLTDPDLERSEKAAIWKQLGRAGEIDAAVVEFERRAEAAPLDSMTRTELGWAYFQKMLSTTNGPERGSWGAKGSDALVQALELDPMNWDARISLAQHYYHAGMRGDSIRELETIIDQQSRRRPEDRHAGAYLFLGNVYMDRGKEAKAKKVWADGMDLFPTDPALRERLKAFD